MRMVFPVLALSVILLGPAGCSPSKPPADAVITVNDRVITGEELKRMFADSGSPPGPDNIQTFLDQTVTREVLIQEAIRRGMDLEEPFRKALKNYYEQNLIKNVTDRLIEETRVSVPDQEVLRAYENMKRILRLRMQTFQGRDEADTGSQADGQEMEVMVGDLPHELEDAAFRLAEGETTQSIRVGATYYRLTLVDSSPASVPPFESVREDIRATLQARRRMEKLNSRIDALRNGASISVNEERLKDLLKGDGNDGN